MSKPKNTQIPKLQTNMKYEPPETRGGNLVQLDCSNAVEIERLAVPLWAIAAGVNTGIVQMICLGIAAALASLVLVSTLVQTWKAKP